MSHRNPYCSIDLDRLNAMEDSTVTDGLPKSRRNNCNSCVQVKRRCDRRTPICSRCAEKKIACIYGKTKVAGQPDREEFEPSFPSMGVLAFGSLACSPFSPGGSPDANYHGIMPMGPQLGVATTTTE